MPSFQVCSASGSSLPPHFWNHVPPEAQQLRSLSVVVPQTGHMVAVSSVCGIDNANWLTNKNNLIKPCLIVRHCNLPAISNLMSLQAWMPSFQVCSASGSSLPPHFWNHVPPEAQQLRSLSVVVPQTGHMVAVSSVCGIDNANWLTNKNNLIKPCLIVRHCNLPAISNLMSLQAWMPSSHVCSMSGSSLFPHFWNHVPPAAQQLRSPLFLIPHTGHSASIAIEMWIFLVVDIQTGTQTLLAQTWIKRKLQQREEHARHHVFAGTWILLAGVQVMLYMEQWGFRTQLFGEWKIALPKSED